MNDERTCAECGIDLTDDEEGICDDCVEYYGYED